MQQKHTYSDEIAQLQKCIKRLKELDFKMGAEIKGRMAAQEQLTIIENEYKNTIEDAKKMVFQAKMTTKSQQDLVAILSEYERLDKHIRERIETLRDEMEKPVNKRGFL